MLSDIEIANAAVMHRITVVLRNGASIDVLSTVPRSAPYFLREVGWAVFDMHDCNQWLCTRMLPYFGRRHGFLVFLLLGAQSLSAHQQPS